MSLSYSKKIDTNQYIMLVPKFLRLLSRYGYSQAQIKSTIELKKDNESMTYKDISVKELLDILPKWKFIKGNIIIKHRNKSIRLVRSPYTNDLNFETDFSPSPEFRIEIDNLFRDIKAIKTRERK